MTLGDIIKEERDSRKLTLLDASVECGLSESQLYRIENNRVDSISSSAVLKLATYYGYDIISKYLNMVNDDIRSAWQSINLAIRDRDLNNMKSSLDIINYIKSKSNCPIVSSVSKQYYYLVEGLICLYQENFLEARKVLLQGMESFNPYLDTSTFNNIGSSSLQLRLLLAYAVTYKGTGDYEKNLYLLNKVLTNIHKDDEEIYKKTTYNIANTHSLMEDYSSSINVLDKYLNSQEPRKNKHYDNIILFKKATVSYRLGYDIYQKYALRALYSSILSNDINNGLIFLKVFNNLFNFPIMTEKEFLSL